ncbi:MAG: ABC transporter ATP-binding protein [Alphaproteobacteria bacterium]
MSLYDDDDGKRVLSNAAVLKFLFRQWGRRPHLLAVIGFLFLLATGCDIVAPQAAGWLVDAVSTKNDPVAAWRAFSLFAALWGASLVLRNTGGRLVTPFASGNMRDMIAEGFARVQRFSAQWHGETFAGSTVRKLSRGMWAYDTLSDVLIFGLMPTMLVLSGLTIVMFVKWPIVGLYVGSVVILFVTAAVLLSEKYTKPAATVSNKMDSRIGGALADAIGNNPAVKSFGAEA